MKEEIKTMKTELYREPQDLCRRRAGDDPQQPVDTRLISNWINWIYWLLNRKR